MSYLKIFPRSITVSMDGYGGYVGQLLYDFEQYGRMMYENQSTISLSCRWDPQPNWFIQTTGQVYGLAGFVIFMNALNHYLFVVLRFDPVSQWSKLSGAEYAYYFERVYFDMDAHEFLSTMKLTEPNTTESLDRIDKGNAVS